MKAFEVNTVIDASPERVWEVLMDTGAYQEWDPFTIRIEGRAQPGGRLKAYSTLSPERTFPVNITEFEANRKMTWGSGMPLGLFTGERTFTLRPEADGRTAFTLREEFTGLLLPLFARSLPDMTEAFESFASGLKGRAERSA